MKLLRFAFLLSLTSVFMYAQRGGGGHAGGGGGHAMGGGGHMSAAEFWRNVARVPSVPAECRTHRRLARSTAQ